MHCESSPGPQNVRTEGSPTNLSETAELEAHNTYNFFLLSPVCAGNLPTF